MMGDEDPDLLDVWFYEADNPWYEEEPDDDRHEELVLEELDEG